MQKQPARRRMGVQDSEVRARLLEAAETLLREEGAAALTARRIAEQVGLKRQIVHYYFGTIEELIVAMMRRAEEAARDIYEAAMQSDEPLRAIRKIGIDASVRAYEYAVLAFRSEAVRAEYARTLQAFRRRHTEVLERHLEQRGLVSNLPPVVVTAVVQMVSHAAATEAALGATEGHDEINAFIEEWLTAFAQRGLSPVVPT